MNCYKRNIIKSVLLLIRCVLTTTSCEEDIQEPLPPYWEEASTLRNSELWKLKIMAGNLPGLDPEMDYIWVNMIRHLPVFGYQSEGVGLNELNVHHIGNKIN